MTESVQDDASDPTTPRSGTTPPGSDSAPAQPAAVSRKQKQRSSTRNLMEWVVVIIGAVVVAILIKTFVVQAFRIPSESMTPTLEIGDRVMVNKLSYDAHDLNRGDVVVFNRPPGLPSGPDDPKDLIKRVIGLPGDTVVAKDGSMYVNDKRLEEPYLPETAKTYNLDDPVEIPEGEVWVMGDNRTNSEDSRAFGPIDTDSIVGRAFMVMWPLGRIGAL